MIKVLKHHVCLCALTTSVFSFVFNIEARAEGLKASCGSLFKSYACDDFEKIKVSSASRDISEPHEDIFGKNFVDAVITAKTGTMSIKPGQMNSRMGGTLQLKGGSSVTSEVFATQKAVTVLDRVSVTENVENTRRRKENGRNGIKHAVFGIQQDGFLVVDYSQVNVANVHGFVAESAPAVFSRSHSLQLQKMSKVIARSLDITVKGRGTHGLHFQGGPSDDNYQEGALLSKLGEFQFYKLDLRVPDGTAVYVDNARRVPHITVTKDSRIFADVLLDVKNNSSVVMEANHSFLVGGARIDSNSYAELELFNKAQWTVTPGKKGSRGNTQSTDSSISFIRLIDSSVFFKKPQDGRYQTLRIGKLGDDYPNYAYVAHGDARLHINASLFTNGKNKGVKADQLVIYGDVYGKTKVYIVEVSGNEKKRIARNKIEKRTVPSISIVQVYGKAEQDSFKLATDYVALRGAPYKYSLRVYAPGKGESEHKGQDNGNGAFWDFRLEPEYIQRVSRSLKVQKVVASRRVSRSAEDKVDHNAVVSDSASSLLEHEGDIMAVVPQVPTYLFLPNALFHSGLMDVKNQNKQLEAMRINSTGMLEIYENSASFLRGYGGSYRYGSDLSAFEYGYGGNLDYNGVEAGILLQTIEDANIAMSFGVMGSYGKLSLQPQEVEQSQKSAFDKWTVTAYGSLQHDEGFYVDGLFSYGFLKGDVLTLARGKTVTLKGSPLSASFTSGKSIITGQEGLVFDPQIQIVYQNLQFEKASDVDGFDIDMEKLDKWIMRVGGRLTKTLVTSQAERVVSLTGKMHFVRGFGGKQSVNFEDSFQLSAFGSSLEVGLGLNAQLSSKFMFHGDVTYQNQIGKAGFSGASFSGGLRYRF
ncbi:autotransporter outer membrane beta-barrel domain-containing protein [Bartonella rattaustraliani]|uniref:autotransporter outer membrane beta-barrel domain-containing protein n=1 Tax=Bartonella rattaustraliani TaxID=481139 RepID=UPI0002E8455C|nr:autotransporter outer membrane beta-barrel domain-containing protein [Bartonella rattaustraliani]